MSDTKFTPGQWVPVDESKFTDTSMGKITYSGPALAVDDAEVNFDGVISTVAMFKAAPDMYKALEDLLDRYVGLVECGDCGNWDAEKEAEVIASRLALAKARGE